MPVALWWLALEPGSEVHASPRLAFRLNQYLQVSIKAKPKKRGRPATGRDPMMGFRASSALRAAITKWANRQPDAPTLSEATRRLVELGLQPKTPARPVSKPGRRLRAQELATKAIEKIIDPAAPPEERAQRRRRLTKGPPEFREDRVDLPKPTRK